MKAELFKVMAPGLQYTSVLKLVNKAYTKCKGAQEKEFFLDKSYVETFPQCVASNRYIENLNYSMIIFYNLC